MLSIRLLTGEACLGALSVYRWATSGAFARRDMVVLDAIGRQASIAIQQARHYEDARRRAAELAALHATMAEITAELDLDALLQAMMTCVIGLLRGGSGELALYDEAGDLLRVLISVGLEQNYADTCLYYDPPADADEAPDDKVKPGAE